MLVLYNIALFIGFLLAFPYYFMRMLMTGKYRKSLGQKFGIVPPEVYAAMKGSPRIWIHAVSVGEVTAAAPVLASLREHLPDACIVLSTSTETGQEMARKICPAATAFIYYPLDFPWVVKKVVGSVKPDMVVLVETELWPHFILTSRDTGAKIVMINGRISPRSFKRYKLTSFFWKKILSDIVEIGAISVIDAERLKAMGMAESRIRVLGNAKYDSLAARAAPALQEEIARRLNVRPEEKFLVAGSTHEGEDRIVLDTYRSVLAQYPQFRLIIVPRHPERGQDVFSLVQRAGFSDSVKMSEINKGRQRLDERVIVVDVIGELFKLYSLASVVFCGGSLVPKGGQNILEPAAWGKVVFYGPSMEDFRDEKDLLESAGSGIPVSGGEELLDGILKLLSNPEELLKRGEKGRDTVISNMGAAQRYASMIRMHLR